MFVSEGYGKNFFGVAQVLMRLVSCCYKIGVAYQILVLKAEKVPSRDEKVVVLIPSPPAFFKEKINEFKPSIIHVHGVFKPIQGGAVKAAKQENVPVIISPHGMLEPWLWKQKGVVYYGLKRLYWNILLKPTLKKADYVHAITDQEAETLKKEFPNVPQIQISNAIELAEYRGEQKEPDADRYLLFIGRLHPKKGVDLLIHAFDKSAVEHVRLVIAGPDFDVDYTHQLKQQVEQLGLSQRITFVGSVHGEEKSELLQKAWCTVIPSYSDVVALVNLESAASYTPTITTTMTGLSDWEEGGGLLVEPELEPLTEAIATACDWSLDKRMQMGNRAREFVGERYSWDVIGQQWVEAYKMIAEAGRNNEV